MQARRFGPAGPEVPVIGIGTWNMELDDRGAAIAATAAIRRVLDLGMVHVDTAELYGSGKVERLVGNFDDADLGRGAACRCCELT